MTIIIVTTGTLLTTIIAAVKTKKNDDVINMSEIFLIHYSENYENFSTPKGPLTFISRSKFMKMTKKPSGFDFKSYFDTIKTKSMGQTLMYGTTVTSTQTLLREVYTNVPPGVIFTCFNQLKGKGRGKNLWISPPGCLCFSFKCQINIASQLPFVQYLVSLALVDAVKAVPIPNAAQMDVKIKWPNDIYTKSSIKIGGILCQSTSFNNKFDIIAGIGINVSNEKPTTCLNTMLESLPKLKIGSSVILCGLRATKYNGVEGIIEGTFDLKTNRYPVRLCDSNFKGKLLAIKIQNIKRNVTQEKIGKDEDFSEKNFPSQISKQMQHAKLHSSNSIYTQEILLATFMNFFERYFNTFKRSGFDSFLTSYLKSWLHTDQLVVVEDGKRKIRIKGLTRNGYLRGEDVSTSEICELHPDGNSFDFMSGLIVRKTNNSTTTHRSRKRTVLR